MSRRRTCCSCNGTATSCSRRRGTPPFSHCDYIGAQWFWHNDGMRVGNGGFSLRSRKLLTALQDPANRTRRGGGRDDRPHVPPAARTRARHPLRRRSARRPLRVRGRVSGRQAVRLPWPVQFLPRRSAGRTGQAGAAILRRHRRFAADHGALAQLPCARAMGAGSRDRAAHPRRRPRRRRKPRPRWRGPRRSTARGTGIGRNDPCPCGSGRKYKHCHGALAPRRTAPAAATAPAEPDRAAPVGPKHAEALRGDGAPAALNADALAARGVAAHKRNDLDAAETRLSRRARAGARASAGAALPRRHPLPARPAAGGAAAARARRRARSARARVPQQSGTRARRRRSPDRRDRAATGARSR